MVAFLDSSVLSFPFVTDILVMWSFVSAIQRECRITRPWRLSDRSRAASGFTCWRKKAAKRIFIDTLDAPRQKHVRWVDSNAFLSVFIPAILPPPLPFKVFVLAEGVFQVPLRTFILALLSGRGLRYFAEGILAVRYGDATLKFLLAHNRTVALSTVAVLLLLYVATRLMFRATHESV